MIDLLINSHTSEQLNAYIDQPSHALLLVGPAGSGKNHLSQKLAESILKIDNFGDYPYGKTIAPVDGKAIGIELVRELEQFLSLKVPKASTHNRIILINESHLLTIEAQNALLKTLEEPPLGTLIIMTASHKQSLLPTIQSRMQVINVTRPDTKQAQDYFVAQGHDQQAVSRAYAISGGLPGLMHAMLNHEAHPLIEATAKARQLLSQSAYDRLTYVDELSKQKPLTADVLFILQQMAHVSLLTAHGKAAKRWQNVLTSTYETERALKLNAQPKLALSSLMLNL